MEAVARIREWLQKRNYDGVVLNRRDNYAFIGGGAENHVTSNTETGVAYCLIERERMLLLADSSDLARVRAEQNPWGAEAILIPWYASAEQKLRQITEGGHYVSDTGIAGLKNVQEELVDLRLCLSEEEVVRYREAAALCARLVEETCREARPGQTEAEVARNLKCRCIREGVSPDCVLVGADERILNYRHPMPTNKKIQNSLMVVLGGEKYGLYTSLTRMVYFTDVPKEIQERYAKTGYIFACMQLGMKEGMTYAGFLQQVENLYQEAGYDGEWKEHHQGGSTGYGCREYVARPDLDKELHVGQAYAWNPTIQGTKCEETTYLTANGVETLTRTKNWPVRTVKTPYGEYEIADILVRK